jgi:peptidoglycan-associated lipoprotein
MREGKPLTRAAIGETKIPIPTAHLVAPPRASGGLMRRVLALAVPFIAALVLSGCPAKPKPGECKSSADCAKQEGYGKVCVQGRCLECSADSDCAAGFTCRDNKCVPRPECSTDADCPSGKKCQGERCVAPSTAECQGDADCGPGRGCEAGKCVTKQAAADGGPECADPAAFTIQFGFDQATLTGESQGKLQKLADCLKKAPAKKVVVQGHCDERGTTQYNLALGARRAEAAKKYLADLAGGGNIDTVSYGKERPLCSDSSEECWARNRRDEFQIER